MKAAIWGAAALLVMGIAGAAHAGPIERACLASSRSHGDRGLCGCIQKAADATLRASDQRLAAKFFTDPNQAEKVRMQSSASANEFWDRYVVFGQEAEQMCRG